LGQERHEEAFAALNWPARHDWHDVALAVLNCPELHPVHAVDKLPL